MNLALEALTSLRTAASVFDDQTAEMFQFHRGQDVLFMLMLVAFLMMFIRRYEWGVALATLLVFATVFPLYILIHTGIFGTRSEEHTSELQSRGHLVCRLLLEKK